MSIEIITPRLVLKTPAMKDAEVIAAAMQPVWNDLQTWMSWAHDGVNTVESIQKTYVADAEKKNFLRGFCRTSGQFVLSTGLTPREGHDGQYETGYWVAKDFLRQGYATEATNAAIRYGFKALSANSIYICHYDGNEASRRVIEKLGFTKTGVAKKVQARPVDGALVDIHEYIMTDPSVLPPLDVQWDGRMR